MTKKPARTGRRAARPQPAARRPVLAPFVLDAALVLLTFVCFWPIARYYFSQDDFVFLNLANHGFAASLGPFFDGTPGQFRPLTKGLYFLIMWPIFGLHATPFHVVSILLHACNAVLVGVLLRRMGFSATVSRVAAAFFAFNVAFLEAVAWASCAQQLIGNIFLLLTLIFGIDALAGGGRRPQVLMAVAYVLALASYEQTVAAPLVLLAWQASRRGVRAATAAALGPLRMLWILLAVYAVFELGVRGIPDSGPYAMHIGSNVLVNLRTYTGLAFSLWLVFPAFGLPSGFTFSHAVWIALVAYHVARRDFRGLGFGLVTFFLLLAPVMFTTRHTHSFHLYVPAIGAWFLVASVVESVRALLARRVPRLAAAVLAGVVVACFIGSAVAVNRNTTETISESITLPRSFVLRRAVIAERMARDLRAKAFAAAAGGRIVLVYPYPQYRGNWLNVHAALGQGAAVGLVLGRRDLDTILVPPETQPESARPDEVFYYTEMGRCFTALEWQTALKRWGDMVPAPAQIPADSTAAGTPGHR